MPDKIPDPDKVKQATDALMQLSDFCKAHDIPMMAVVESTYAQSVNDTAELCCAFNLILFQIDRFARMHLKRPDFINWMVELSLKHISDFKLEKAVEKEQGKETKEE